VSNYETLAKINVNDKIEKKNGLSYLSWAWAVDQLLRADPAATWTYKQPSEFGETLMVHCEVTAFGKAMTAHLPVMDHRNKAISNPDAFAVNTAMQRCLVKAIALHGLGLYIYAGEDLPEEPQHGALRPGDAKDARNSATKGMYESLPPDMQVWVTDKANAVRMFLHADDERGAWTELTTHEVDLDEIAKAALWGRFDSKERSRLEKISQQQRKAA
jgi:hypothetical protein